MTHNIQVTASEDIFDKLLEVRTADKVKAEGIRDFLEAATSDLNRAVIELVRQKEYYEDPEVFLNTLVDYHYLVGGLIGVGSALYRKLFEIEYRALSTGDVKIPATDKERLVRGATADVEGILEALREMGRNLHERIDIQRGKTRRGFGP